MTTEQHAPPEDLTRTSDSTAGRDAPPAGRFLCQYNVAILRYAFHSPEMLSFRERLQSVHEEAERDPDYVGRYEGEHSAEGYIMPHPNWPRLMGGLTAWRSLAALRRFVFDNVEHREIMRRKRDWFDKMPEELRPYNVLYVSDRIDLEEAKARLDTVQRLGPTAWAFTWKEAHQCGF